MGSAPLQSVPLESPQPIPDPPLPGPPGFRRHPLPLNPMRLSIFLVAFALTPLASAQEQDSDWYWQLGFGSAGHAESSGLTRDITYEDGYALGTLVGYRTDWLGSERWNLSFEGEMTYVDNDVKNDGLLDAGSSSLEDLTTISFMAGAVLEWQMAEEIYLYAGAGIGWASKIELNNFGDGPTAVSGNPRSFELDDEQGAAYQGKVGLRYDLGGEGNFSWLIGLRFFATEELTATDSDLNQSFDMDNESMIFETAMRWGL